MSKMLIFFLFPVFALAHGSKTKTIDEAVTLALAKFEAEQSEAIVNGFSGVKAWVSGSKVRVKAYYNMHQEHILYTCESVHSGGQDVLQCAQD